MVVVVVMILLTVEGAALRCDARRGVFRSDYRAKRAIGFDTYTTYSVQYIQNSSMHASSNATTGGRSGTGPQ